jgi:hypothetical protein
MFQTLKSLMVSYISRCYRIWWLSEKSLNVKFQVLVVTCMKTAFWDVVPYSFVEVHQLLRGAYCLYHQGNEQATYKKSSSFPFPFVPLQRRGCLVAPLFLWIVLVPCVGYLAQWQGWRVKGRIWPSEQARSARANSWLDYQRPLEK